MLKFLAPYLAYGLISVIGWTSRVRWVGREHIESLRQTGSGWLYAFWHQRQVFFTYTHRGTGASVMVSRSRDGELIAKVMELSRIGAVRGSSSRGGAVAARELLELGREGRVLGITPDGPKGPAREVKPGVLYLARESGLPIIPISNATSRRLVLERAWDKFHVPLPFSRACVIFGAPIRVGPGDDLAAKAAELKAALDGITDEAERIATGA
ncbi:MAG: lysophospholipid acyltransferase family protein [Elusimicrobia bacterium]|nr:lysophospholipid acyltransferase family protein [Elusimicrobiota bacterium]